MEGLTQPRKHDEGCDRRVTWVLSSVPSVLIFLGSLPRVGFSVSRSFPSCFACGHSLLPVQPSPKGEEWKVGSEKQARMTTKEPRFIRAKSGER